MNIVSLTWPIFAGDNKVSNHEQRCEQNPDNDPNAVR